MIKHKGAAGSSAKVRDVSADKPKTKGKKAKATKPWKAQLNKNLMNYSLARDPRSAMSWRKSRPSGKYWVCRVPGEKHIQVQVPTEVDWSLRRIPNSLDNSVLAVVLSACKKQGNVTSIKLGAASKVLRLFGYKARWDNILRLRDSLRYWQNVRLRYAKWYDPGQKKRVRKLLLPPIKDFRHEGHGTFVTVRREWAHLADSYWASITLPLPRKTAEQNLMLLLSAWPDGFGAGTSRLCDKIGLGRHHQAANLRRLLGSPTLQQWLDKRGLALNQMWSHGNRRIDLQLTQQEGTPSKGQNKRRHEQERELEDMDEDETSEQHDTSSMIKCYAREPSLYVDDDVFDMPRSGKSTLDLKEVRAYARKYPSATLHFLNEEVMNNKEMLQWLQYHIERQMEEQQE